MAPDNEYRIHDPCPYHQIHSLEPPNVQRKLCCFISYVSNTATLYPSQQLEIFVVGLTFDSLVGATFSSFVWPTVFVSQHLKTVGVGGNYATFIVLHMYCYCSFVVPSDFGSKLKSVGGTFSFLVLPTISVPNLHNWAQQNLHNMRVWWTRPANQVRFEILGSRILILNFGILNLLY